MSENTATEKILGLYTLLLMSSRPWSLSMLAKKFDCSKPTMIRLLARIERIEGIAVRLRVKKKVQNLNAMWYKEFAKNFATQGDFGHESP